PLRAEAQRRRRRSGAIGGWWLTVTETPLMRAEGLTKYYGPLAACADVSIDIHEGEVVAVVGESGSGKSTLLSLLSTQMQPTAGQVQYRRRDGVLCDLFRSSEAERRFLLRTEWGFVHQEARLGLRMGVSAGANVGERLMSIGWRNYGRIRGEAMA